MSIIYGHTDTERRLLEKYPKEVKRIEDIPKFHQEFKIQARQPEIGIFAFFRKWKKKRQLAKFENNKNSALFKGAKGEQVVLDELSKFGNEFHVFCDLRLVLPRTVTYNGQKNLRSAQMDFVVVSKKGVFVIEVKNWCDNFAEKYDGFSPYEQTNRAGRVLWLTLKNSFIQVPVSNILLSIIGNLYYNRNYRTVLVSSLDRINELLLKQNDVLSEKEVKQIVSRLKNYVRK